jgi:20S proteasome alpha/beta subunit
MPTANGQLKINPFRPGQPVPAGTFAGRYAELHQIFRCLLQTEKGAVQNILITGERGIGKTSIAYFTKALAGSEIQWLESPLTPSEPFLCVYYSVQKNTPSAIAVSEVVKELEYKVSSFNDIGSRLKSFVSKFEGMSVAGSGFKLRNEKQLGANEVYLEAERALRDLATDCATKKSDGKRSICIIIDETDRMADFENFASFWKVLQERLGADDYRNLMLVLVGMPEIKAALANDHESFLRTFTPITLGRMTDDEAIKIIQKTLLEGSPRKTISETALMKILFYSERFPHLLQEIGYSAYEVSAGAEVTTADVDTGVHGTDKFIGSISRLGELFFSKMYDEVRRSDNYRELLQMISNHSGPQLNWVARQTLLDEFSKKKTSLDAYLQQLVAKKLIERNIDKPGEYRLVSTMFQIYLDKIFSAL